MSTIPEDPWGNYYFSLELDGVEVAHFQEMSGLKTTAQVYEIQEGGLNGHVHLRTSASKWENIVLKYATSASTYLLEWRDKYLQDEFGSREGTSGSIVMRDNTGAEVRRFSFLSAWPVAWEGPSLQSGSSDLAVETLEIAHEGILIDQTAEAPEPEPEPEPEDPDDIVVTDDEIKTPPVQFEYDSAQLTSEGDKVVGDVAKALNNHPEITEVWIEGHTCTMGSWSYNLSLSRARANTVKTELQNKAPGKIYHSTGFAYKFPVSSNATEGGRSANRRTEFHQSSWDDRGRTTVKPETKPS